MGNAPAPLLGMVTLVIGAALATACESPELQRSPVARAPPSLPTHSDAAVLPAHADAASPDAQLLAIETASAAAATFGGDDLRNCVEVAVTVTRPKDQPYNPTYNVTAEQMAILALDNALTAFADPKIKFAAGSWEATTKALLPITAGRPAQPENAELAKVIKKLRLDAHWPPDNLEKQTSSGELAKVDSCMVPGRIRLGTCLFEGSATGADLPRPDAQFRWDVAAAAGLAMRVGRYHFDVASTEDSDVGFKTCLVLGGKWSAPAENDTAAALERARQHALKLRGLYGR